MLWNVFVRIGDYKIKNRSLFSRKKLKKNKKLNRNFTHAMLRVSRTTITGN
jgi:hypothetical protein